MPWVGINSSGVFLVACWNGTYLIAFHHHQVGMSTEVAELMAVAQSIRAATRPIGNIKAKRRSRGVTAHRKCGAKKHRNVVGKQLAPPDYSGIIEYRLHNKRTLKPLFRTNP